jgi:hypothetical protein
LSQRNISSNFKKTHKEAKNADLKIDGVLAKQKNINERNKSSLIGRKKSCTYSRQGSLNCNNSSAVNSLNKSIEKPKVMKKDEDKSLLRKMFKRPNTAISNYNTADAKGHNRDKSQNLVCGTSRNKLQTIHEMRGKSSNKTNNILNSTFNRESFSALGALRKKGHALDQSRKSCEPDQLQSLRVSMNEIVDFKEMRNRNKLNRQNNENSDLSELISIQRENVTSQNIQNLVNSKSSLSLIRNDIKPFAEVDENTSSFYDSESKVSYKKTLNNEDNFETLGLAGKMILGILQSTDISQSMQLALLDECRFAIESKMKKKHFKPTTTNIKLRQALKSSSKENADIKYEIALSHIQDALKR